MRWCASSAAARRGDPDLFLGQRSADPARYPGRSPVAGGLQPRLAANVAGALLAATLARCPYEERWPLANALVRCAPEVQARAKAFEAEWRWLCGDGESTSPTGEDKDAAPAGQPCRRWPSRARTARLASDCSPRWASGRQPMRVRRASGPVHSAPCSGLAGCSRPIPSSPANSARSGSAV